MALDVARNLVKVTVSTGYDAVATTIVLTAGQGALLPAVPFNMTWWNSTDYSDPSDDPNVEIVRVTAIATDTLTVTRGQESIAATTKNTVSKTYKMFNGITAKVLSTDINQEAFDIDGNGDAEPVTSGVPFFSDEFEADGNSDIQPKNLAFYDFGGDLAFGSNNLFPLNLNKYPTFDYVVYIAGGVTYAYATANDSILASSADSTTVIQTVLDKFIGTSGGNLLIQQGTYTINSPLLIRATNTRVYGVGKNTLLQCDGSKVPFVIGFYTTDLESCRIQGLQVNNTKGTNGIGIKVGDCPFFVMEDMMILNFTTGLQMIDSANLTFYGTYKNLVIESCLTCIDIAPSGNPVNDNTFIMNRLLANANGYGIRIRGGSNGNNFYSFEAEPASTTGTKGVSIEAASFSHSFFGCYCEGNAIGINIASGCQANCFFGGLVEGNTTDISDAGNQNIYMNLDLTASILMQLSLPMTSIDQTGNSSSWTLKNNTSFAHVSSALMILQFLNGSDTSTLLKLANAGTGLSLDIQDGSSNSLFKVRQTGYTNEPGDKRVTADFTRTSSTVLTNVTGLSASVEAGRTYAFEAILYTTANSASGIQAAIAGTATATNIVYEGVLLGAGAIVNQTRAAALATAVCASTATTAGLIRINGTITVNAAGTLTVQFAQNVSGGTGSVVKQGSSFIVRDIA